MFVIKTETLIGQSIKTGVQILTRKMNLIARTALDIKFFIS